MNLLNPLYFIILLNSIGFVISESCSFSNTFQAAIKDAIHALENVETMSEMEPKVYPCKINPSNCADLLASGFTKSGIYQVFPKWSQNKKSFEVFCDQETDGGGWTVFQRRIGASEDFFRDWADYKKGFGNLRKDFWLGNDYISILTTQDRMQLRVDLEDFANNKRFAKYKNFLVLDEAQSYLMTLSDYEGTAGNSLLVHSNNKFVTKDRDKNDCSRKFKGGWWYKQCHEANLNGLYLSGNHSSYADGVNWVGFKGTQYSLKFTEMKIRPQFFIQNSENAF